MNFTISKHLKPKIATISKDSQLLELFTQILKVLNNNHKNSFFVKSKSSDNNILTISMTNYHKMDIDFKVRVYDITILNILIHDEWFSNL